MLEKWIRPLYQRRIIRPIIPLFCRVFTPDQITVISGVFGIAAGLLIALNYPLIGTLFLLLSGMFDTLDGTLARHMSQTSNFGCVIDIFIAAVRYMECEPSQKWWKFTAERKRKLGTNVPKWSRN